MTEEKPDLLTLAEAMRFLRISERTAHRWIRAGILPAVKIGGRWRVPREALERLIKSQRKEN